MRSYDYKYLHISVMNGNDCKGRTAEDQIQDCINESAHAGYRVAKYDVFHGGERTQAYFLLEKVQDLDPFESLLATGRAQCDTPRLYAEAIDCLTEHPAPAKDWLSLYNKDGHDDQ